MIDMNYVHAGVIYFFSSCEKLLFETGLRSKSVLPTRRFGILPLKTVMLRRNDTKRLILTPRASSASAAYGYLQLMNFFDRALRFKGQAKRA